MPKEHSVVFVLCLLLNLLNSSIYTKTSHNITNVQKYHDFFVHAKHSKQQKKHCTNKIISKCIAIFKLILNNNPVDLTLYSFFSLLVFSLSEN